MDSFVIVWYDPRRAFTSYWKGDLNIKIDDTTIHGWGFHLEKATVFNRSQAEKMYKTLAEYYNKKLPNSWFGAKIVEYIPPKLGSELLSEKDQVISDLKGCLSGLHPSFDEYLIIKKTIAFLERKNNNG